MRLYISIAFKYYKSITCMHTNYYTKNKTVKVYVVYDFLGGAKILRLMFHICYPGGLAYAKL